MVFFTGCTRVDHASTQIQLQTKLPNTYTVKQGDTYTSIAKELGFPNAKTVMALVGTTEELLRPGQVLNFSKSKRLVKTGSSLKALAKRYNMDYKSFLQLNKLDNLIPKNGEPKDYKLKTDSHFYVIKGYSIKKSSAPKTTPSNNGSNSTKVTLTKSGKTMTVNELQRGAISAGKNEAKNKFREYCQANGIKYNENLLDLSPIERYPAPTVKNGKITTTVSDLLKPTGKSNGKVVILNAGHGGYNRENGYFDPGAYSFIKKANGKYAPLLEYDVTNRYTKDMADKLRAKGYSVIITSGSVHTFKESGENAFANLVSDLKKQGYKTSDITLLSLHADSEETKKGSSVRHNGDSSDSTFVKNLNNNLNQDNWIVSETEQQSLAVLNQTNGIKSALVEIEYVNGGRCNNLDSKEYQKRFIEQLLKAF